MIMKYSRQRAAILSFLQTRKDHPTAELVYSHVKEEYPNISLGTVYRNLSLLTELGEIRKISTGDGPDHFDGDTSFHHHFICRQCHQVIDLRMENIDHVLQTAADNFSGQIDGYVTNFYGLCEDCCKKTN